MFTKNHTMGNAHARMNCISSIDTVIKFLDDRSSLKKNAYKIGLILIIVWYARKVLFSGVFATGNIFQDGGIVMDENGRNGRNWHLAQQTTQPVIRYVLSSTTNHIARNVIQTPTTSTHYHTNGGIFISLINIKNFPHTL